MIKGGCSPFINHPSLPDVLLFLKGNDVHMHLFEYTGAFQAYAGIQLCYPAHE